MSDDNTVPGTYKIQSSIPMTHNLTLKCGLRINLDTGEVFIPDDLTLDDASRAFWEFLGRHDK